MRVRIIAAAWGFAEATAFFLVPDILLSVVGRRDLRRGMVACLFCLAGALSGGMLIYAWAWLDVEQASSFMTLVPAIDQAMMDRVAADLQSNGVWALFIGPLVGIPYKTFAAQAYAYGVGPLAFLVVSVPARIFRFLVVTTMVHYCARLVTRLGYNHDTWPLIVASWVAFYAWYFTIITP